MSAPLPEKLNRFNDASAEEIPLPDRFNFPHFYTPNPIAILAAEELQQHLATQTDFAFSFGDETTRDDTNQGKMFGVLVVRDEQGRLGYLAAFSGKLAESNHWPGFVPPVYDLLPEDGYYKTEEKKVNAINARIEALESDPQLVMARAHLSATQERFETELEAEKEKIRRGRARRKQQRETAKNTLIPEDFIELEKTLAEESVSGHFALKDLKKIAKYELTQAQNAVAKYEDEINILKQDRKQRSNQLQSWIFAQYRFLNAAGKAKDLKDIFKPTFFGVPPAGAGECAAPKLLQYAYLHRLQPITMAEFWWGQSPGSEIRRHRQYYPACKGKCEPILGHMLEGIEVDPNPMLENPAVGKELEIIYEDEHLAVVNKPAGFLSVPGRNIEDSVQTRMQARYPESDSPLIVHRLDMSTSGILLIAKTKTAHEHLQKQFLKRTIKKRYIALLNGTVKEQDGVIDLPLRGDFINRPQQIVCYEAGKPARTKWQVIDRKRHKTLIHFWPITGRTHQLRVHAAHPDGLDTPIVGDDLYGTIAKRLYLHAEWIKFQHPFTKEEVEFRVAVNFW